MPDNYTTETHAPQHVRRTLAFKHGRSTGAALLADDAATPATVGPRLNGERGTALIRDTGAGRFDGDDLYERGVGLMRFIPSTWSIVDLDADGDGPRKPRDNDDAGLATWVYLCPESEDVTKVREERASTDIIRPTLPANLEMANQDIQQAATAPGGDAAQLGVTMSGSPAAPTSPTTEDGGTQNPPSPQETMPRAGVEPVDAIQGLTQAMRRCVLDSSIDNPSTSGDSLDRRVIEHPGGGPRHGR